ncbi:hypothetical protein N0V90_007980 [Kalmusia sp. IMI 367209]|nr:hypothetical protein N0V90_007980 [Kalmusia sp. IMI 367209]
MADNIDLKKLSLAQLNDLVAIRVSENRKLKTVVFFRYLIIKYAPSLTAFFVNTDFTGIELKDVTSTTLNYFCGWLCSCYIQDSLSDRDLWSIHGVKPDWTLLNCSSSMWSWDQANLSAYLQEPLDMHLREEDNELDIAVRSVDLFIFAKAYKIPRLRQDALDRLCWFYNSKRTQGIPPRPLPRDTIRRAYNNTSDSPLRELLLDGCCTFPEKDGKICFEGYPRQFLATISEAYADATVGGSNWYQRDALDPCDYHEHERKDERKSCNIRVNFCEQMRIWDTDRHH